MPKIMLVDGNSIINRAFYAMPLLTDKNGEYTNAVYGFLNIFFKLIDEEKPEMCIVCFDVHQPTFRHLKYEAYKGTRKSMPEELRPQIPLLKKVLGTMNIKTMELGGYEADDLLGTLAKKAESEGIVPVIVSGDRDLLQLASENIKVRNSFSVAGVMAGLLCVLLMIGVFLKLTSNYFEAEEDIRPFFASQLEACGVEYFDF
ncbi:MAG: hypothetical protein IJ736_01525, partial [Firmicutes bacterium]|nr:hypothetical protein [Bacillota bacterium]